jgi:hypothetical protein
MDAAQKKTKALQVLLNEEEAAKFERLVASRAAELKGAGVTVSEAGVLRWLILSEVTERGLDQEAPPPPDPPKKKNGARR